MRAGKQIVSIALEKLQSAQLAEKIDEILDQLMTVDGNPFHVPASTPLELVDNDDLEAVQEQFRAGVMSLGWDPTVAQVVIEAYPLDEVDEDDDGLERDQRQDENGRIVSLVHEDTSALRRMAMFDVLVNNSGCKGDHVLPTGGGHRYSVDHGLAFHSKHNRV